MWVQAGRAIPFVCTCSVLCVCVVRQDESEIKEGEVGGGGGGVHRLNPPLLTREQRETVRSGQRQIEWTDQ